MTISDFFHFMEQWHLDAHGTPCATDSQGWVEFGLPPDIACAARLRNDGEVEIVASPGYAEPEVLARFIVAGAGVPPPQPDTFIPLCCWADGLADWTLTARAADGLAVLAQAGDPPLSATEWENRIRAFAAACGEWEATARNGRVQ